MKQGLSDKDSWLELLVEIKWKLVGLLDLFRAHTGDGDLELEQKREIGKKMEITQSHSQKLIYGCFTST
jgi:hypothetical protein